MSEKTKQQVLKEMQYQTALDALREIKSCLESTYQVKPSFSTVLWLTGSATKVANTALELIDTMQAQIDELAE